LADFARYSFPSKLTEYCRYERPIVVWGPEFAACVAWARKADGAVVVTDPDPAAVISALDRLAGDPALARRYSDASRRMAETEFNPQTLQAIFESALDRALGRKSGLGAAIPASP
jgi:glycosyltransferase involved in cell wall biosynthesis